MKRDRDSWLFSGVAVLGIVIAACSSKSTDEGVGNAGNGGANNLGGAPTDGGADSTSTGGKNAVAGTTGGRASTGGASTFDPNTYCNGIFKEKSCSQTQVQANVKTVNMLLVLDESGSMNLAPAAGAASKWSIMKQALNTALTQVQDDINFGLELFPFSPTGIPADSTDYVQTCAVPDDIDTAINVPITAGRTGLQEVLDTVANQSPAGGTPTARALKQAYNYFKNGDGQNLPGTKWVLLATDGGPNCNQALTCNAAQCTVNIEGKCSVANCCLDGPGQPGAYGCLDDSAATSQIQALANVGVKTFVVGVPGSEAYASALDSFANAGKMPNQNGAGGDLYYAISATSAQQDLIDAFSTITTQLIHSCDIELTSNPPTPDLVNVAIDCEPQAQVPTGSAPDAGVDGYYIDYSQTPAHLKLVGAPCNNLVTQGAHHIEVIVGCQPIG
jgi:hypothetical protein